MVKHLYYEESRKRIQSLVKSGKQIKTVAGMLDCSLDTVHKWANSPQIVENTKAIKINDPLPILYGVLASKVDQLLDERCIFGPQTIIPIINKRFKIDISAHSMQ